MTTWRKMARGKTAVCSKKILRKQVEGTRGRVKAESMKKRTGCEGHQCLRKKAPGPNTEGKERPGHRKDHASQVGQVKDHPLGLAAASTLKGEIAQKGKSGEKKRAAANGNVGPCTRARGTLPLPPIPALRRHLTVESSREGVPGGESERSCLKRAWQGKKNGLRSGQPMYPRAETLGDHHRLEQREQRSSAAAWGRAPFHRHAGPKPRIRSCRAQKNGVQKNIR